MTQLSGREGRRGGGSVPLLWGELRHSWSQDVGSTTCSRPPSACLLIISWALTASHWSLMPSVCILPWNVLIFLMRPTRAPGAVFVVSPGRVLPVNTCLANMSFTSTLLLDLSSQIGLETLVHSSFYTINWLLLDLNNNKPIINQLRDWNVQKENIFHCEKYTFFRVGSFFRSSDWCNFHVSCLQWIWAFQWKQLLWLCPNITQCTKCP